jgi:hypothetical protein
MNKFKTHCIKKITIKKNNACPDPLATVLATRTFGYLSFKYQVRHLDFSDLTRGTLAYICDICDITGPQLFGQQHPANTSCNTSQ